MSDDVTITVRVNNQTAAGFRDINGQLRTLDGRFATSAGNMRRSSDGVNRALVDMRATMLSLAPAAIPVAASLAPIAVHAGAAGVAVAAFGAAVGPQIGAMKNAVTAQDKYSAAVAKYGQYSKQANEAQMQAAQSLAGLPKATQQAAGGFMVLRDQFKNFSDSTAKFTMVPVEHSFAILGALLPKLKPMVEGTSTQLDRLMKVAGGAINTSAFDGLAKRFSDFANNSLKSATDGAIHFIRVLSEGNTHGPISEFMAYAKAQGPAVRELLSNLVKAIGNIAQGAAQAGPGLLTVVNAFAKLVAAAPPQLIGNLMQIYAAFKLIKLAGAGISTVAGGFTSLAGKVAALQTAAAAAGGGMAGLKAAFLSLGAAARATVVVAGIAAVALVLTRLSNIGKQAPPDIDRMTTALGKLAQTGKASGEAARVFGDDFSKLGDSLRTLARPSNLDKTQQFLTQLIGMDSTPVKDAKQAFDGLDKALANMVKGGKADLAKVALEDTIKALKKQGFTQKEITGQLDDYKSALADQALEQQLAAQSMGLFGKAAQDTQAKLDAQKQSADGLRQSIQALNDVNRQGLGGMIGFEAAIDAAAKAAKDNHGALTMTNGVLNLNSEKARNAASALQDLADKTDSAAASQREAGASWETVNGIYSKGRAELIKQAHAMGLSKDQAAALADQILKIPNKTAVVKMNTEDATRDLNAFNSAVRHSPSAKSVTLKTLSSTAEAVLKSFGYKVTHLPNGSVKITASAGGALATIGSVRGAIASLHDKHIVLTTEHRTIYTGKGGRGPNAATGGLLSALPARRLATGGEVQGFPDGGYIQGPGGPTSDSIIASFPSGAMARVSNSEYVVQASAVRKYGVGILDALNQGRLKLAGFARGGHVKKMSQAEKDARKQLSSSFGISYFGRQAGYHRAPFEHALGAPTDINALVDSLNQAAGKIKAAFSGKTESSLLKHLNSVGKALISQEKQLNKVTASLSSAKDKLNSLKDASAQLASSVKGNLISSANITKNQSGGPVTLASVKAGLSVSKDKVTAFATALKQLKAKGFSASIIQQVAEAGIDGGGLETAGALLQASASEVKTINKTQADIESAAGSAGKTTASAVYDNAIKYQTKVVEKLTHQQEKLEKSMAALAKSMEKLIQKALGHKAAGGIVGAAASGGLRGGLTMVGEHGFELLDLPAGARVWSNPDSRRKLAAGQPPWASMLTSPRRAGGATVPMAVPGGVDRPIVLHVSLAGKEFGQLWIDVGRKEVKTRGGLTAALGS